LFSLARPFEGLAAKQVSPPAPLRRERGEKQNTIPALKKRFDAGSKRVIKGYYVRVQD
jgi:hypothetical protein